VNDVALVAVVRFDGSATLVGRLRAQGVRVEVFDALPAALAALRHVRSAVLVARWRPSDRERAITFVVRNLETLAADPDRFHDRFAQVFDGPVDAQTLYAAAIGSVTAPERVDRHRSGQVA
jgi:hypothetical protein